eukprot:jgi/Astpho2/9212/Aster-07170
MQLPTCSHQTRLSILPPCTSSIGQSCFRSKASNQAAVTRRAKPFSRLVAMADPQKVSDPKFPYPEENAEQKAPGDEHKMGPRPDYGYDSYKGSGKLKEKVALVTGGDSGIGRAIALAFAREGAHVAIAYWNEHEDAKEAQKAVEEAGVQCILLPGDLAEEEQCKKVVDETVKKFGRVDILVNNASYQGEMVEDFADISRERLERTFKTNIIGMISLAQKATRHMGKGGAIINIASIQAYQPMYGIMDYASTKVVESFPKEMIREFGKDMAPAGRPGQPAEYGPPAVFLACERDSSYISGSILGVTGGMPLN